MEGKAISKEEKKLSKLMQVDLNDFKIKKNDLSYQLSSFINLCYFSIATSISLINY